ncbi:MAG: glycosyltransferase family 2 protein [Bacteroidales bacterium]
MRVLVIIPVYNEADSLPEVLRDLHETCPGYDLLVVNDASTDASGRLAEDSGLATVIHLPCNLGIGGCVQTGFRYAVARDYDVAVQFDGDGQHNTADIGQLVHMVASGETDVAIGSRFNIRDSAGFRSTNLRRMGIRIFQATSYILTRQRITDHTSGFRAYNRKTLAYLAENYPVDYPEPEMIITLGRRGFRIQETFSQMFERQGGASSIPLRKGPYYMLKVLLSMMMAAAKD